MPRFVVVTLALVLMSPIAAHAQAGSAAKSVEPFKVGTFRIGGASTVGLVLRDTLVVDLGQANAALEKSRSFPARSMPSDMVDLIAEYENGLKGRISRSSTSWCKPRRSTAGGRRMSASSRKSRHSHRFRGRGRS